MKNNILVLLSVLGLFLPAFAYNVNSQKITLSGISSGAYFANQFHISHSRMISGVAMIAGGPFNCSEGKINRALNSCMKTSAGAISTAKIVTEIRDLQAKDLIDSLARIPSAKVFLLAGSNDDVVANSVVESVKDMYVKLDVPAANIKLVTDIEVGHAFPTVDYGNSCKTPSSSPFISRCQYDGAYEILNFLHGNLKPKTSEIEGNLKFISQKKYFASVMNSASMGEAAAIYVPTACQNGAECSLHVSFHGCLQSRDEIGDAYFRETGFNAWAEANNIIVLYPQAIKSYFAGNPNSCWDWWGYTGKQFHTKKAVQIEIVRKLIEEIITQ